MKTSLLGSTQTPRAHRGEHAGAQSALRHLAPQPGVQDLVARLPQPAAQDQHQHAQQLLPEEQWAQVQRAAEERWVGKIHVHVLHITTLS